MFCIIVISITTIKSNLFSELVEQAYLLSSLFLIHRECIVSSAVGTNLTTTQLLIVDRSNRFVLIQFFLGILFPLLPLPLTTHVL